MVRSIFAFKLSRGVVGVLTAVMFASLFLFFGGQAAHAAADTCTWTGSGIDTSITTAGNWTGCDNGNLPGNGDSLIFPAGPLNKVVYVDSALFFNNITFSGDGYAESSVDGTVGLYANGNITISGDNNVFNSSVWLFPTTSASFTSSGSGNVFTNDLVVQAMAANPDVLLDIQSDTLIAMFATAGSNDLGQVSKTGAGTLQLTGEPVTGVTAVDGINISDGKWRCDSQFCLGDDSNVITLSDGGDSTAPALEFAADASFANPIVINTPTDDPGVVLASANANLTGGITVTSSGLLRVGSDNTMTIDGNVSVASGKTLYHSGDGSIIHNGIVSGSGNLSMDEAHVTLAGSNTYTGTTELTNNVAGALVTVVDNNSLGNHGSDAGTTVNPGSTLNFDNSGDVSFEEPITVGGTGVGGSYPGALVKTDQYVSLNGGITMTDDTTMHNETTEMFTIASTINGHYDITMTANNDAGGFGLAPGGENAFRDIIANGLQLTISGTGHTAVPNNLTLNAVNGKLSTIWLNSDNTLSDLTVITLNNDTSEDAILLNTGISDSIGSIVGNGIVRMMDADAHFSMGLGDTSGDFSGTVQGYANSQFQIIGGVWTFSGYNTDIGDGFSSYYVSGGTMLANAADDSLGSSPFSMSGGLLGGSGTIGATSVYSGTVAPGNSPGCLNVNGDMAFTDPNSYYVAQIQGSTACTQYDKLTASGTIYLNNATLTLDVHPDLNLENGTILTIMSAEAIAGTFDGVADGQTITVNGSPFKINYSATTVNLTYLGNSANTDSSDLANTGLNQRIFLGLAVLFSTGTALVVFSWYLRRQHN